MHFETALWRRAVGLDLGFYKTPNHIGRRGALSLGKRLQFSEDSLREFYSGLHTFIVSRQAGEGGCDPCLHAVSCLGSW